jgi:predicted kinase
VVLGAGASVVVEGNFFRDQGHEFAALPAHRLVQLRCGAPLDVLLDRYSKRRRHAGHHDAEKIRGAPRPIRERRARTAEPRRRADRVDTAQPVDFAALAERIRVRDSGG